MTPATFTSSLTTSICPVSGLPLDILPGRSLLRILLPTSSLSLPWTCPHRLRLSPPPDHLRRAVPLVFSILILSEDLNISISGSISASCLLLSVSVSKHHCLLFHTCPFTGADTKVNVLCEGVVNIGQTYNTSGKCGKVLQDFPRKLWGQKIH